MAENVNLRVFKGQAATITFPRARGTNNATGWTLVFTVKTAQNASVTTFSLVPTVDGTGAVITATVSASQNNIGPATFFYDLWRTDPGSEDLLAWGEYLVQPEVRVA